MSTEYVLTDGDKKLKVALYNWRAQVHHDFWGTKSDYFLSPKAIVLDKILDHICHLAHAHAVRSVSDIENNVWGAQQNIILKHGNLILRLILSHVPFPTPPPLTTPTAPIATPVILNSFSTLAPSDQFIMSHSPPSSFCAPDVVANEPKAQQRPREVYQCGACHVAGHTSKLNISHHLAFMLMTFLEWSIKCPANKAKVGALTSIN